MHYWYSVVNHNTRNDFLSTKLHAQFSLAIIKSWGALSRRGPRKSVVQTRMKRNRIAWKIFLPNFRWWKNSDWFFFPRNVVIVSTENFIKDNKKLALQTVIWRKTRKRRQKQVIYSNGSETREYLLHPIDRMKWKTNLARWQLFLICNFLIKC